MVNPGGHCDAEITQGIAIFYEHDHLGQDVSRELWQKLNLPEPTFQVDTGNKSVHSHWVFEEPISIELWKSLQTDLLEFADGNRSIKNPSRVMRLAGFKHGETGKVGTIISQSGHRYDYETLRAAIPSPTPAQPAQPQGQDPKAISWPEFDRSFQLPYPEAIPLEICLSKASRAALEQGAGEGGRNDTGAKLARDLLGTADYLSYSGQRYDGDPWDLFNGYCDRCSPALPQGERVAIWKSAQRDNPGPSLSPEAIEGCAKAWVWKNCVKPVSGSQGNRGASKVSAPDGPSKSPGNNPSGAGDLLTLDQVRQQLERLILEGVRDSDIQISIAGLAKQSGTPSHAIKSIYQALANDTELSAAAVRAGADLRQLETAKEIQLPIEAGLFGDGGSLARKIRQVAEAMPTAPEFLVTTLIPVLATAMGTAQTLVIHATAGYKASPIFRSIIVAPTGRKKTPAQAAIMGVLTQLETSAALDHAYAMGEYEADHRAWIKASKGGGDDAGPEPKKPIRKRYLTQDSTLAARIQIHAENPRGLLLYKDEASAFITERGRFTNGKGDGGEFEADLSEFNGGSIMCDRKGDGSTFLAKSAISRVGATQYSTLQRLMGSHDDDCGEFARYLFCAADAPPSKIDLSKDVGDIGLTSDVMAAFTRLSEMPEQAYLLDPDAKRAFQAYQHELTDRQIAEDHPSLQSAYPKFETYFGRFILWLHLVNAALADQAPSATVDGYTVELARQWTEYYIAQLKLVLALNSPQQELTGDLLKVYDYLKRKGKPLDVRSLSQGRLFSRSPDKAKQTSTYLRNLSSSLSSINKAEYARIHGIAFDLTWGTHYRKNGEHWQVNPVAFESVIFLPPEQRPYVEPPS